MDLITIPPHTLRVGQVVPFGLRNAEGKLLIAAGQVLQNTPMVQSIIQHGAFAYAHETKDYQRALNHKMDTLMHQGAALTDIVQAKVELSRNERQAPRQELGEQAGWADLQQRTHALLRDPLRAEDFLPRFEQIRTEALSRLAQRTDSALMLLIFEASQDYANYSAQHGLLCLALGELGARQFAWPEDWREALSRAALSMNITIVGEQERLAIQAGPPSDEQREALRAHGQKAAELLMKLGVSSSLWLDIVRLHHDAGPGTLAGRPAAEAMARLLRRADIFAARMSPRRTRPAQSGAAAARTIYLDELQQPDEAGGALIKTVGLYPPGSLVKLANGEIGVVTKRGHSATQPMVAVLLSKSGSLLSEPVQRDTRLATQAVAGALAPHEVKLLVNVEKVLKTYQL